MKRILGISAFGLKDCVATSDQGCTATDFYLADAVLPQSALGHILTGDDAEEERIHSGLLWPPEAQVTPDAPLRRVPIPVAWSLMVDAGDRPVRWNAGKGVSIPLANILAAHIKGLTGTSFETQGDTVVAIPDHLDEFGQETLLQALGGSRNGVKLVWRPVAAAMAWLDQARPTDLATDDYMLVIYMGPDAMEFSTFGLRKKWLTADVLCCLYATAHLVRPCLPVGSGPVPFLLRPIPSVERITGLLADIHQLSGNMGSHRRFGLGCTTVAQAMVYARQRLATMESRPSLTNKSLWLSP